MQQINELIDAKLKEYHLATNKKRDYLGASSVGDPCLRKIQLQYMQCAEEISSRTLRTFAIGNALEPLVADWLRVAGFHLKTDNTDGKQFGFSIAGGRIAGHVDGVVCDGPDFLKCPCLWECKTMNEKNWNNIRTRPAGFKTRLLRPDTIIYGLHKSRKKPCLFTVLNKNTSELYFELVPFDMEAAQLYSDRAALIVQATERNEALPCISNDPSYHSCKACSYRQDCLKQRGICE
jgi:hypothetical protein